MSDERQRDERLTKPDLKLAEQMRNTPHGMAHWAGTGPEGRTCRECAFFEHGKRYYSATAGFKGGELMPARCGKYRAMMNGRQGGAIPNITPACRHFEPARPAPARFSRDR